MSKRVACGYRLGHAFRLRSFMVASHTSLITYLLVFEMDRLSRLKSVALL